MEGIVTAIVGFIFVCIVFPRLVRNKTQFYAAFGMVVLILFFWTLAAVIGNDRFNRVIGAMNGLLTLGAFVMLVLATGGLSLGELTGEFKDAFEVIRRGESEKEVIIPLSSQQPPRKQTIEEEEAALDAAEARAGQAPPAAASPSAVKPAPTQIPIE